MASTSPQMKISAAIIRAAQEDADFSALTGGRIFPAEDPAIRDIETPAVAFTFLPGRKPAYRYDVYVVHFLCYSPNSKGEAMDVADLLDEALNRKLLQRGGVNGQGRPNQTPSTNYDEELGEHIASFFWEFRVIEPDD